MYNQVKTLKDVFVLKSILSIDTCQEIVEVFNTATHPSRLNLMDDDNQADVNYTSKRSPGLQYKYLSKDLFNDDAIKTALAIETGLDFVNTKSINNQCLPVFKYTNGVEIKAHRDTNKDFDINLPVDYVAVAMLSNPRTDFQDGRLYLNFKAEASKNGKGVIRDHDFDRIYPEFEQGDIVIFNNARCIHAVEPVKGKYSVRYTCGWRFNH